MTYLALAGFVVLVCWPLMLVLIVCIAVLGLIEILLMWAYHEIVEWSHYAMERMRVRAPR